MKKFNYNYIIYAVFAVIGIGLILELVGGIFLSPPLDIGINTNISAMVYVGFAFVLAGLIAYIILSILAKRLDIDKKLKDILMLVSIIAIITATIYLVCVIIWPAVFPANG